MDKTYNIMYGVAKCKYLVNFHDGYKTHNDGSPFFDIKIFKNKKKLANFEKFLIQEGYVKG
jgi:hypothetical protein